MIKEIYDKYKGKLIPCLVNNECGNLVDGYGVMDSSYKILEII